MKKIIFVLGGCRSGKSRHALDLAEQISTSRKIFIATCVPRDEEMKQRVERHRKERSSIWETLEIPILLPEAVLEHNQEHVVLVDCLTLWISNLLMETDDFEKINDHVRKLTSSLEKTSCTVVLVSNETGLGIVPENKLARLFRDAAGFANQQIAACADRVIWMVAGIPVTVK